MDQAQNLSPFLPDSTGCFRLIERMIWFNVADATRQARRGVPEDNNSALAWLWDVARDWAEATGGAEYERLLANLCEEIAITAENARQGQRYQSPLLRYQLKRRDRSHL